MSSYPSRSDIVTAMSNPRVSFKVKELIGGRVIRNGNRITQYSGGYTTVFPFFDRTGKKLAIRCWVADIGDAHRRCREISDFIRELNSAYFTTFRLIDKALLINGVLHPIVAMDWVDAVTLKEYVNNNISRPDKILAIAEKFREMVAFFHSGHVAHGDLQHGNILVNAEDNISVVDYDSMYVTALNGMSDIIKGLPGYQHPARASNALLHEKLDYFSELVIYLSLKVFAHQPDLWPIYYPTEDLLFSKDDFLDPYGSALMSELSRSTEKPILLLLQRVIEELQKPDILELRPLEALIRDDLSRMDWLHDKWGNQPNPPQKRPIILPASLDTISKF